MFCIQCKREIPEGSMYCAFCGCKQEDHIQAERQGEVNSGSVRFTFGHYEVNIPTDACANLEVLKSVQVVASECRNDYIAFYKACDNIKTIIAGTPAKINAYYKKTAKEIESVLIENGVFGISEQEIIEHNQNSYKAFSIFRDMQNAKEQLDTNKDQEIAYREYRKNRRSRFVGGGFGLSGAVKGMAMAGAANMATGAAHSIFNVFGNAVTKTVYNNRMDSLKYQGFCGRMACAVEEDCLLFIKTLGYYLKSKAGIQMLYDMTSIAESNMIIEQIEKGKVSGDQQMEALCRAFIRYPLNDRFYELFCKKYGDSDGEIIRSMEYFGLDPGQVQMILASRIYCSSFFGDKYLPVLKSRLKDENGSLDEILGNFYHAEVNPYLLEDINNVPHLFIEDCIGILQNSEYCKTFEDCNNVHYLYQINKLADYNLDMDQEVPLCLIRLSAFSMKSFLLITSKSVILPIGRLKIQYIDSIQVTDDEVIFCGKYSVKNTMFCRGMERDDLLLVLTSIIMYIQFAYNLNQEEKTISLLGVRGNGKMEHPYDFLKEDYMSAMAQYGYVSQYVASLFKYTNGDLITVKNSAKNMIFIQEELKIFQLSLQQEKFVLLYISLKNGIYITEQNLYFHIGKTASVLPINQVVKFDYDEAKELFIINDCIQIKVFKDKRANEVADHFMQIIKLLQMRMLHLINEDCTENASDLKEDLPDIGISQSVLDRIKKSCGEYKVSSTYDDRVAAGEFVGPERIKNFDEVVTLFGLEPFEEIYFYNNDSTLFSGQQGLLLCTSGLKIVSKRGKFTYHWKDFQNLCFNYSFFMDGLYINNKPVLQLQAEGKKTCRLLNEIQKILSE